MAYDKIIDASQLPKDWSLSPAGQEFSLHTSVHKEASFRHPLKKIPLKAIAYSEAADDILFQLADGSHRLAVVHLTYSRHYFSKIWPSTLFYDSFETWYNVWK